MEITYKKYGTTIDLIETYWNVNRVEVEIEEIK